MIALGRVTRLAMWRPLAMYHIYGKAFHGLDPAKHIYMNKAYQNRTSFTILPRNGRLFPPG